MKDIELYQKLLDIVTPWQVQALTLKKETQEIEVRVVCTERVWACPTCGQRMHVHAYEERRWRHLDSCQYKTVMVCRVPTVQCPEHGAQSVTVPWAERYSRFSCLFERLAIDLMQECSIQAATQILRLSWAEADGIKQRAVERGLARKAKEVPAQVCVDEKAVGHGQDYVLIVARLESDQPARVEYVGDGRTQASLDAYWQQWTRQELAGVQAVGLDMLAPFYQSTVTDVPEAVNKIVYDPFHLDGYMNQAVNQVRKDETRALLAQGDDTLQGTRDLWLYGWENLPEHCQELFHQLGRLDLQTNRAWSVKELWRDFWACPTVEEAREYFRSWYARAIRSRLEPVKQVARMFKARLANILTYFEHRLSNGPIEALNHQIQSLIQKACGYRNRERFKRDILFHLGGLDLYPKQ